MKVVDRYGGVPEPFQMAALDQPLYAMVRDSPTSCWHYILGRMVVCKDPQALLCSLGMSGDGELVCGVNFSRFIMLGLQGRKTMFKYLCLRFLFGHLSTMGERLRETYGKQIFDTAACIAIDQAIDLCPLIEEGYIMPNIHFYSLPEGLETEEYCVLLKERADKRKADAAQMLQSVQDMMKQMMDGADPNDPAIQEQMRKLFGDKFDPNANVVPPDDKAQLDPMAPDSHSSPWSLSKPPPWIKNGKVDEAMLKKAVEAGEVDLMPPCDTFMDVPPELADIIAKKLMLDAANNTDMKGQGWFKGEAEQFIAFLMREPVLSWTDLLRQRERTHMARTREPTRRRPSRRHPAYWGRKVSRQCYVVAWIDTSGSMGERELACIAAELVGLVRRGCKVLVGQVDADIQQPPVPFENKEQIQKFFGRGGTDFRPAFAWMAEQVDQPDFVVYFTDGCGTAPDQTDVYLNSLDILWVLTDTGMKPKDFKESVCAVGDAIVMDTESNMDSDTRFNKSKKKEEDEDVT